MACRGGIPEILVVSSPLQSLDDLQNWRHFQTVVSCYCKVLDFAVAYSRAFVLLDVCDSRNWNCRSNSFVREPSSGRGSYAPRPAVSVPHLDVNADRR